MRDAVGCRWTAGAASGPMAAAGDGDAEVDDGDRVVWDSRDVEPHQRLWVESPKGDRQAEKKVCFKIS